MIDYLLIAFIVLIIALALVYIYKSKKRGKKCIGCPYSCSCSKENRKNCK